MLLVVAMAAFLAGAEPQAPASPVTGPPTAAPAELKPGERRVKIKCKNEGVNGSRVVKRRCLPLEEWARMEEEAQKSVGEIQSRSPVIPTCSQSMRSC